LLLSSYNAKHTFINPVGEHFLISLVVIAIRNGGVLLFRGLCVNVLNHNQSSVRGEVGKDAVTVFYEKVTALTGDQPPVVMVNTEQVHNNNPYLH
jgi:hypothetical protein